MTILPSLLLGLALVGCREKPDPNACADGSMPATWYLDGDGDGFGGTETTESCDQPEGYVATSDDCNDADAAFNPTAVEDDCADPNDYNCDGSVGYADADEDGFAACADCDDGNSAAFPGAEEICDGIDNNCDVLVDDQDPTVVGQGSWYIDYDGDGFGSDRFSELSCAQPEGYVDNDLDCDDASVESNPDADEICDGFDNDCDSEIDEEAVDQLTWYLDTDGDGYGDETMTMASCEEIEGYVELAGDCDDSDVLYNPGAVEDDCDDPNDYNCDGSTGYTDGDGDSFAACEECNDGDATINPDAEEVCDDVDNDCDALIDDEDSGVGGRSTWYIDYDGDSYGSSRISTLACDQPDSYVDNAEDCDDGAAETYPGALEICDGSDNDCDSVVDDEAVGTLTWYLDEDGDGYGLTDSTFESCDQPDGYAALPDDCDDADAAFNPGAVEDDCADPNDYNCDGSTGYDDADGDGFAACDDCDDDDPAVNPAADEICDDVDNDCDGSIDDDDADVSDRGTWYIDYDGDSYGSSRISTLACDQPDSYVANDEDCNDNSAISFPGAPETCDDADNDCDDVVDNDPVDALTWYLDGDDDGYGLTSSTTEACDQPDGYAALPEDCDDSDDAYNPGADESDCADPNDYNCDGSVGYADEDGDGYAACEDCDDDDGTINPDGTETCDDVDNDCDGAVDDADSSVTGRSTWYLDYDDDSYGSASSSTLACDMPSGYVTNDNDCDDGRANTYPGASEVCDDIDNDCDGTVDDGATGTRPWYADGDDDGYGDPSDSLDSCSVPDGYVSNELDCDDTDGDINPAASEICDDLDNDCDSAIDDADDDAAYGVDDLHYEDADDDTYGSFVSFELSCDSPDGYVSRGGDCDDTDGAINPLATELCDGVDNNCTGGIDESSAADASTWYFDDDGDSFGGTTTTTVACTRPADYSELSTDCNDADDTINPDADEVCNDGIDNDCDPTFDSCTMSLADADVILTGEASLDDAGVSFAGIGDQDADGFDDLVIGARNNDTAGTDAGALYLFEGPLASGTVGGLDTADLVIVGGSSSDRFGRHSVGGVDLTGDGLNDLVVSAPNDSEDGSSSGTVYLFSGATLAGATSLSASDATARWNGRTGFDYLGIQVANADLTGDGTADLVMTATGNDDGASNAGAIYVYAGPITATGRVRVRDAGFSAKVTGESSSDQIGQSVGFDGDFDGDGVNDLIVGVTNDATGGSGAGSAHVLTGPLSGSVSLGSSDAEILGDAASGALGNAISYMGDQDGDGYDDMVVGSSQNDSAGSDAGAVFVVSGRATPSSMDGLDMSDVASATIVGPARSHQLGTSVAANGDFDGDGTRDLLIGAPNGGSPATGFAYLFIGPVVGTLATTDAMASLSGESSGDAAGNPVGFVGDIGDIGTDAIGVTSISSDRAGTDAGTVYFLFEVSP